MATFNKEELIYNKSIGDIGMYLVINKLLPNELALVHYDIVINIEIVNMKNEDEVKRAENLLVEAYDMLSKHRKFRNRIKFEENKITLLAG